MRFEKCISMIIILVLVTSGTTVMVSAENSDEKDVSGPALSFAGGSGTEADPYEISNVTHLQNMNDDLSAHYELINDIDASETVNWNGGKGFLPIGNDSSFSGSLDGQGYDVNNLYINRSDTGFVGLIGKITSQSTINNIGIKNANITGEDWVGVLIGHNNGGTIEDSHSSGNISGRQQIGGLVGLNSGPVNNSYSHANVSASMYAGGLAGINNNNIDNSYATGNVSAGPTEGGLIGENNGFVNDSYALGDVTGTTNTGGLVGRSGGPIRSCQAEGTVTCTIDKVGGLVGVNEDIIEDSTATGDVYGNDETGGLVGNNDYYINNSVAKGIVNGGDNTGGLVGENYNSNGAITATVNHSLATGNVSGGRYVGGLVGFNEELVNDSYALGNIEGSEYVGGLLGRHNGLVNHSFALSDVVSSGHSAGVMLGTNRGTVNNSHSIGSVSGTSQVGGLAGGSVGPIRNSYANADVVGTKNVGGLVGHNYDVIDNSTSLGTVTGTDYRVGGLVGSNEDSAGITGSYSDTVVEGENQAGGLVGYNSNSYINTSYALGNTSGVNRVGGLIGYNQNSDIDWCSNDGDVYGEYFTGGLIGFNYYGNIDYGANYGRVHGDNTVGGLIGQLDGVLNNSYNTVDVEGNYTVGGLIGENNGHLLNSYSTCNVNCTRNTVGGLIGHNSNLVKNSHYNIDEVLINGEHRVTIGGLYNSQYDDWFSSGYSLDIGDYSSTLVPSGEYYDINNPSGFKDLLGFADDEEYKFRLGMDVDLSSEPGLHIPYLAAELYGDENVVENLQLDWTSDPYVKGSQRGFVGHLHDNGKIENVGLFDIDVKGYSETGGLVGYSEGTVNDSFAVGNVEGFDNLAGGLIGENEGLVNRSHADVDVVSCMMLGGLVGENDGHIEQSFASGEVRVYDIQTSKKTIGGLVGLNGFTGDIKDAYAVGDVYGDRYTGGLVGSNQGTINRGYSTGAVTSEASSSGGLIGSNSGDVFNSFWDEDTSGMTTSDGGTGKSTSSMKSNFTYTDLDTSGLESPWDFVSNPYDDNNNSDIWDRHSKKNDGYPFIKAIYDSENREPVADAGKSRTVEVNTPFVLDGSGSYDDVEIVNYTWTSGPARTYYGEEVTISFASIGIYPVTLNVTDQAGKYDTDSISITTEDTTSPVADAGSDQTVNVGETFTLDGSGSTDNYGIEYYNWTCGTDEYYGETVTLTNDTAGEYTYTLKVTDQYGYYDTDTVNITVEQAHTLEADAGPDQTVNVDETFTLNASGSTADYEITGYTWTIEGTEYNGEEVTHGFSLPGYYTITLTIEDSMGKTDSDTVNITVVDETPPVADAGEDRTVAVEEVVTFNASGSYDNVGITNYTWTLKGEDYYKEEIQHIFINEGVYEATLTVRDEAGNSDSDSVNITVMDQTYPVADAGPDQTVNVGEIFTLNGSDSYDFVGITNYTWTCESTVLYGEEVTHSFSTAGTYTFTLNVTDEAGNYDTDTVNITVIGDTTPPVADAGPDQNVGIDETFTLNGSGSSDDGTIVNYTWIHDSLELYGEEVTHSFSTVGTYTFTLNVSDEGGNYDTDIVNITVEDQTSPTANAGGNRTVYVNSTVVFDGSNSTDNVGIIEYTWTIEGDEYNGVEVSYIFTETGTYDVTLNVTDAAGNYDTDTITVTVKEIGEPIAHINGPTSIAMGTTATYNGSESTDDHGIVNYTWTIEGSKYYGEEIEHTFDEAGTYDVTLNVSDGDSNYDSTSIQVTVVDSTNPVADAGEDKTIDQGETITFDGSGSTDNVEIVQYTWTILGSEYHGETVDYTFNQAGKYTIELEVNDEAGNHDTDIVNVSVLDNTNPVADAGEDKTVDQGVTITFDGSGSTDNVGIVQYTWTILGSEYNGETVDYTFEQPGGYTVNLEVTDEAGNYATDIANVTVLDITNPVADAGQNQTIDIGTTVTFNGTGSYDNVGINSFEWRFDYNGTTETLFGPQPDFTFDETGDITITLTVTDIGGNTDSDTLVVTVEGAGDPVADAGEDRVVNVNEAVTFDGSGSTSPVEIVNYVWTIEGSDYNGVTVSHEFKQKGVYDVELTVTDEFGNDDTDTVSITVEGSGIGPVPIFDYSDDLIEGKTISFDASESSSPLPIETYEWDFGDGTTKTGEQVTHEYSEPGTYNVSLTITDENGDIGELQESITIKKDKTDDDDESDDSNFLIWLAPVIAVIVLVLIFLGYRSRNKPDIEDGNVEETDDDFEEFSEEGSAIDENEDALTDSEEDTVTEETESDSQSENDDFEMG